MDYPDLSYAKVLAVDDSPSILCVVKVLLGKYHIAVHDVLNGKKAIELMDHGEPVFNVILMDYLMPEMDGIETVMGIRALGSEYAKQIPIIAVTAVGNEIMFLEHGFQGYLAKPITAATLGTVVQKWIKEIKRD